MPNWIEGTMKLRGKAADLIRFFENGFDTKVEKKEYSDSVLYTIDDFVYINGSRRAFTYDRCDHYIYTDRPDDIQVALVPIRQAWSFTPYDGAEQRWIDLAKEYNLDIRLQGFERGIEFFQDVEIVGGEMVRNDVKKYEDWDWECPMPRMGG